IGDLSGQIKTAAVLRAGGLGARASITYWPPSQSILEQKRRLMGLSDEAELSKAQRQRLQQLASEFEKAWKTAETTANAPVLDTLLPPPEDSLREDALHDLIKTDLSMRWQRGQRICVEEYLENFPELGNTPKL